MKTVLKQGTLVVAAILMVLAGNAVAETGYVGSETCFKYHPGQYNDFIVSGHSYKLSRAKDARHRPIPLPEGYTWDDISYVIGGKYKKARFIDHNG